ncbi:MAG: coniferyl-alcohol dehydrogenase [Burkholderiaceae bacterium]
MRGKHVVVTGGATGIGEQTCELLAAAGAQVTILDVRQPRAGLGRFVALDLSRPEAIAQAVASVDGPVHALCNVAGLPPRAGMATQVLRVNFLGLRDFTRRLIPQMEQDGAIVNVGSRAGARWRENLDQVRALLACDWRDDLEQFIDLHQIDDTRAFDLSKEAVIVWSMACTQPLLAHGLRMNSISPGAVSTGILDDFMAAFGDHARRNVARVGRPATALEVAESIVFLISPQSAWLRGIDLVIDGGISACSVAELLKLESGL